MWFSIYLRCCSRNMKSNFHVSCRVFYIAVLDVHYFLAQYLYQCNKHNFMFWWIYTIQLSINWYLQLHLNLTYLLHKWPQISWVLISFSHKVCPAILPIFSPSIWLLFQSCWDAQDSKLLRGDKIKYRCGYYAMVVERYYFVSIHVH